MLLSAECFLHLQGLLKTQKFIFYSSVDSNDLRSKFDKYVDEYSTLLESIEAEFKNSRIAYIVTDKFEENKYIDNDMKSESSNVSEEIGLSEPSLEPTKEDYIKSEYDIGDEAINDIKLEDNATILEYKMDCSVQNTESVMSPKSEPLGIENIEIHNDKTFRIRRNNKSELQNKLNDKYIDQTLSMPRKTGFKCPSEKCSYILTTKACLGGHIRRHHTLKDDLLFKCVDCTSEFGSNKDLVAHRKEEHGFKTSFQCDLCGFCSNLARGLRRHLEQHTSERNFSCGFCGATFKTQGVAKSHELIHTRNRDFQCEICSKTFKFPFKLKRHKLTHSDTFEYECTDCEKKFHQKINLKIHLRKHHIKKETL